MPSLAEVLAANPKLYDPSWVDPNRDMEYASQVLQACATCEEIDRKNAEIGDLRSLLLQFTGTEATYIRWMIDNQISLINHQISVMRESLPEELAKEHPMGGSFPVAGKPLYSVPFEETRVGAFGYEPPPVPSWMKEYMEASMPAQASTSAQVMGIAGAPAGLEALTLRPMGAQAKLSPEQLGLMAGYMAWGKAGSPYMYSPGAITEMADWRRHFSPYVKLSESLFPKQVKLGKSWMPAKQR